VKLVDKAGCTILMAYGTYPTCAYERSPAKIIVSESELGGRRPLIRNEDRRELGFRSALEYLFIRISAFQLERPMKVDAKVDVDALMAIRPSAS